MYRFRVDEEKGILFCYASGCWTSEKAHRFVQDMLNQGENARQRFGRLRMLIDSRRVEIPGDDVVRAFAGVERHLIQSDDDRVANIVASNFWKHRTRRAYAGTNISSFLSDTAAMAWLNSHESAQGGRRSRRIAS